MNRYEPLSFLINQNPSRCIVTKIVPDGNSCHAVGRADFLGNRFRLPRGVSVGQLRLEDGPGIPESVLLPAIVKSADDAILGATTGGLITTWNADAEKICGYRAEEIIGQPL